MKLDQILKAIGLGPAILTVREKVIVKLVFRYGVLMGKAKKYSKTKEKWILVRGPNDNDYYPNTSRHVMIQTQEGIIRVCYYDKQRNCWGIPVPKVDDRANLDINITGRGEDVIAWRELPKLFETNKN